MKGLRTLEAFLMAVLAAACADVPTQPVTAAGTTPSLDETNQGLTITCPSHVIDVNEVMYCTITYNGTNVTASTNLYSMNTAVVTTGANGYVKGIATGGTLVWGSYNGITVSWDTQVTNITVGLTASKFDAYEEYVTWTATPSVAGSYHYTWEQKWCYNGNAPGDCDGLWHAHSAGVDLTTRTSYVHARDQYVSFRVTLRRTAGGSVLGTATRTVYGANEGCTMC